MQLKYLFITLGLCLGLGLTACNKSDSKVYQNTTLQRRNAITTDNLGDKIYTSKGGDGNFYNGTITQANSRIVSETEGAVLYGDFYLTKYNTSVIYNSLNFVVTEDSSPTHIKECYLATTNTGTGSGRLNIYQLFGTSSGMYAPNVSSFIVKNVTSYEGNISYFLETFFNYQEIVSEEYYINKDFNYNAPYGYVGGSTFVTDSTFTTTTLLVEKTYDFPYFISNGQVFNRIIIDYIGAYATRYIDNNGDQKICENEGFGYYSHMRYVNTYSNLDITVNKRNWSTITDSSNNVQYALNNGSDWVNTSYQNILTTSKLTPTQKNNIEVLNTNLGAGYIAPNGTLNNNIGLSSVFTLIASAFSAVGGFLAIQIMPGLSLGILLFAPLIVGIILAIIWLVKR